MTFAGCALGFIFLICAFVAAVLICASNAQTDDPTQYVSYWWAAAIAAVGIALIVAVGA